MSAKRLLRFVSDVCLLCVVAVSTATAQAQAPSISSTTPQAVAPGKSADVTIRGANLAGVTRLWTSFPAETVLAPKVKDNGKNNAQVVFRMTVPAETAPGVYGIRVVTPGGVSPLRLFVVDDLPSTAQDRANKSPAAAQQVSASTAVDGVVDSLSLNYYKFPAHAGQQIVFEVLARRIGSALDPMIRILDTGGHELTYSEDEPGLSADSRLSYTFEKAGEYLVEVRDIRYQGGANYFYRLRIGDFPCVTVPHPMGAKRDTQVILNFAGPNVDGAQPVRIQVPSDPQVNSINVAAKRAGGQSSGFALLAVGDGDEFIEQEPNDDPKQANRILLGVTVNGRLEQPGDVDRYVFTVKQGQKYTFAGVTRQQGSPADLYLQLLDASGKKMVEAEDSGTIDGIINYTFPADGDYTLVVENLNHRGGSPFAYRVVVTPTETGFSLQASADRLNVPAGGTALVTVTSARKGYNGPIEIVAVGLPNRITSMPTVIGTGQNSVVLTVRSAADAVAGKLSNISIVGRAKIGQTNYQSSASLTTALKAAFAGMPWPPETLSGAFGLAVSPAPKFTLKVLQSNVVFGRDLKAKVKIVATRQKGFDDAITLALTPAKKGLPANVTVALKPIPKGKNEIEIEFSATGTAALGDFTAVIVGTLKQGKVTVTQPLAGLTLKLQQPFQLTAAAGDGKLTRGGQLKFKVAVTRNSAFHGPVALSLQNLPKGVTAAAVSIPADKNEVEVVLSAAADAKVGAVNNVTVKGDATVGKAKLSATSPAIKLTVN